MTRVGLEERLYRLRNGRPSSPDLTVKYITSLLETPIVELACHSPKDIPFQDYLRKNVAENVEDITFGDMAIIVSHKFLSVDRDDFNILLKGFLKPFETSFWYRRARTSESLELEEVRKYNNLSCRKATETFETFFNLTMEDFCEAVEQVANLPYFVRPFLAYERKWSKDSPIRLEYRIIKEDSGSSNWERFGADTDLSRFSKFLYTIAVPLAYFARETASNEKVSLERFQIEKFRKVKGEKERSNSNESIQL